MPRSPSGPGVDVLVGHAGGHDHDLTGLRPDGLVTSSKGDLTLLDHEDLRVRMGVQIRSTSPIRVDEEERYVRATVEVPLEPVRRLAKGRSCLGSPNRLDLPAPSTT